MGRKTKNLKGLRFGLLVVVEEAGRAKDKHAKWLCQCDCGRTTIAESMTLQRGYKKSCGCLRHGPYVDLTGRVFGKLLVLREDIQTNKNAIRWLCRCECGKETTVLSSSLLSNNTRSCGCLRQKQKLPFGESAKNRLLRHYKQGAKKRNLDWVITLEQFHILTKSCCYYCNTEPQQVVKEGDSEYVYNGIDRIDNSKGYAIGNCVPCCGRCNAMKSNLGFTEFIEHVRRIYEHFQ